MHQKYPAQEVHLDNQNSAVHYLWPLKIDVFMFAYKYLVQDIEDLPWLSCKEEDGHQRDEKLHKSIVKVTVFLLIDTAMVDYNSPMTYTI